MAEHCYRHPDRETGVSCSSCGRPICPDCMTPTPVGMRCPECASQKTRVVRNPTGTPAGFEATPATYVLIAINVIVFLVEIATGGGGFFSIGITEFVAEFALFGPSVAEGEWYRLLTSGFLHASLIHIGFNMFLLLILGRLLEPSLGTPRFLVLYFASLLAGSLGALVVEPNAVTIGASGAVFGHAGAVFNKAPGRGMDAWPAWTGLPAPGKLGRFCAGLLRRAARVYRLSSGEFRMKKLSLAVVCAAFVAAPALAQDSPTLKKIKDSGTITIGHRDSSIPFSYYDDKQQVVGYAIDICMKVVDAIKAELKMPNLQVKLNPVTSATRIPLIANGTIDLECGSTTNNLDRQKQVGFTNTYFVTANRYVAKKSSNIKSLADLKGKTIVSTAGTTNLKWVTEENQKQNLGMSILTAKDHAEAFLMVETGRAVAFFMDDILLYSLVANSKAPADYAVGSEAYTVEPYGAMMPRDDAAFRKLVDDATAKLYKSGEMAALYDKWFLKPIPPKGIALNVPMSAELKKVLANPTSNGDPAAYK